MSDFIPGFGTEARQEDNTPKQAKGGVYAPADTKLIADALMFYINNNGNLSTASERQAVNLLHRLNRI